MAIFSRFKQKIHQFTVIIFKIMSTNQVVHHKNFASRDEKTFDGRSLATPGKDHMGK